MEKIKLRYDLTPGNLFVYSGEEFNTGNFWGIILPKDIFMKHFEKEKGFWPTEQPQQSDKFGYKMPKLINGVDSDELNTFSSSDHVEYMPKSAFMKKKHLFGGKIFGDVYSPGLERVLGFEVLGDRGYVNMKTFPFKNTINVRNLRSLILCEFIGGAITHGSEPSGHIQKIAEYIDGKYFGKTGEDLFHNAGHYYQPFIELMRECNFPEGNGVSK